MSRSNKVFQPDDVNASEPSVRINIEKPDMKSSSNDYTLTWQQVNVKAPPENANKCFSCLKKKGDGQYEGKHIIKDVNGIAKPGEVLAIMGASGAGKTTLLNVLTFRNKGNLEITGDIRINGKLVTSGQQLAVISGYVQQNDIFIGTLKVKEHLRFYTMLKMGSSVTQSAKDDRVEEIMTDLNLKKCQDTLIGVPSLGIKGISGGEMRRLAFASEIITNPGILFCDEPTSGLDSFMAMSIVDAMKNLALKGKTIICTIHQPSSEIFEKFDSLYLMAEGRVAYSGPLNEGLNFFSSLKFTCPGNYNPADFYIKTLAIEPNNREECIEKVQAICDSFERSSYTNNMQKSIQSTRANELSSSSQLLKGKITYKASGLTQFGWLLWRSALSTSRSPIETRILAIQTIFIAIMFGLIYLRSKLDQQGVQNINGVLFLLITNSSFSNIFGVVNSFPNEIPIFLREHSNAMYRVFYYYFAKSLVELPKYIVFPLVFTTIVYWMTGLDEKPDKYLICCAVIILVSNAAVSFGSFLSTASPSVNAALALSGPLLVPLMIFSGYFLNNDSVPVYFIWLRYLSWLSYANEILVVNQWRDITNIACESNSTRCFRTGDEVVAWLSFKKEHVPLNFILMGVIIVALRLLAFGCLYLKAKLRK